jgi:hypothetical protein
MNNSEPKCFISRFLLSLFLFVMHKISGKKATKTTNKQAGHFKITFLVHQVKT